MARVFGDYPDLEYVKDLRGAGLPPHIDVRELFMKTGDDTGNGVAQQHCISTNYSFVARDMLRQGMDAIAQTVAQRGAGSAHWRLSLSSNRDVELEVAQRFADAGLPLLKVAVINAQMP